MAKRFTETTKWSKRWFRKLAPEHKLAWFYVLDWCDPAGVLEVDEELANFQIASDIDWDEFIRETDGRIERLDDGKLWVVGFVEYQYGEISEQCNAHKPVFKSLEKHGLLERVQEGLEKGSDTLQQNSGRVPRDSLRDQDKDKDKDKDKDQDKDLSKKDESDSDSPSITPDDVLEVWNAQPGIKQVRRLTQDRRTKCKIRLQCGDWPWREAIAKLPLPREPGEWQPDFDWLILNETNALKLVEGKYDWTAKTNRRTLAAAGRGQRYDGSDLGEF